MEPARSYRQQQEFRPGTCTVVFLRVVRMVGERQPAPADERADGIGSYAWSSEVCEGLYAGCRWQSSRAESKSFCLSHGGEKKKYPTRGDKIPEEPSRLHQPGVVWLVIH